MTLDELTQLTALQQTVLSRHDQAIARHEQWLANQEIAKTRHDEEMAQIRAQQQLNNQNIANLTASIQELRNDEEMAQIRAQQQLNNQNIASLTASIQELRNIVSDYIQGRSNL